MPKGNIEVAELDVLEVEDTCNEVEIGWAGGDDWREEVELTEFMIGTEELIAALQNLKELAKEREQIYRCLAAAGALMRPNSSKDHTVY